MVRIFQKAAGMAPLAFLTKLRLGLAHQSITTTNASLMSVAVRSVTTPKALSRGLQATVRDLPGQLRGLHQKPAG